MEKNLKMNIYVFICIHWDFPHSSDGKESACNAEDQDSIPGLGRSSGGGHGNPFQSSCLENPHDKGAWQFTVHGVTKTEQLSTYITKLLCYTPKTL